MHTDNRGMWRAAICKPFRMNYELKQNCVFARFLGQVACSRFVLVSVFSVLDWKEDEFSIFTLGFNVWQKCCKLLRIALTLQ